MAMASKLLVCGLLTLAAVAGLSGIDLVLPAVPFLPQALGGGTALAQFVLAAYVVGAACGLLLYGSLGVHFGRRRCLAWGLVAYGLSSWLATLAPDMSVLVGIRFLQGVASSAPAVFAPGIIRAMFSERGATRAIGALASVESLTPGAAPLLGLWLLELGGWRSSFWAIAALALALGLVLHLGRDRLPPPSGIGRQGSYARLLRRPAFLRYAWSQAFTLGGVLVFVFGAPAVIVHAMDGSVADFAWMQAVGVGCFILASNATGFAVERWGAEAVIWSGSLIAALGAAGILLFALFAAGDSFWLVLLFAPVNAGLGLRGPPGFLQAIIAGEGDDDRAASLTVLAILAVAAVATALVAPWIAAGLPLLAGAAFLLHLASLLCLALLPVRPGTG
ncbi:MFS transporter [Marinibaculum pumilum]|uniref:MFS transporter n=1 Tax=Marinibaculum pumilum TaxID=1766165 RepID=A0ABV7L4N5_9PROT